jgi:hypothetical protein
MNRFAPPPERDDPTDPWPDRVRRGLRVVTHLVQQAQAPAARVVSDQILSAGRYEFCFEPALDDGFAVRCVVTSRGATVWYDGWHTRFDARRSTPDEVAGFVLLGLTDHARLETLRVGQRTVRWQPHIRREQWIPLPARQRLLPSLLRRGEPVTLQNRWLEWERYQDGPRS